jgi:hypothetical protein
MLKTFKMNGNEVIVPLFVFNFSSRSYSLR